MRLLPTMLLLTLATCTKVPAESDEPTSGSHGQPSDESATTAAANSEQDGEQDESESTSEPAELDVEITGVGACSQPEDCEWVSAPYVSAEDLKQDSFGCCVMSCQRPNMVVSKALLEEAAKAEQSVCADHRSGKAQCPPPSPCRKTGPHPYVIEPLCEAGQCAGRALPIEQ